MVARSAGTVHDLFPVAVGAAEGQALRDWVVRERATRTIEIGLGYGISALFVCEGLLSNGHADARHLALDPHQAERFGNCGLQVLEEAGVASFCLTNLGWRAEAVSPPDDLHQWAVLRTSAVPDRRPFDDYVEF